MTSPFRFKYPLPPQTQTSTPTTPSTQLSARNFILSHRKSNAPSSSVPSLPNEDIDEVDADSHLPRKRTRYSPTIDISSDEEDDFTIPRDSSTFETPIKKR